MAVCVFNEVKHCKNDIALDARRVKVGEYNSANIKLYAEKMLFIQTGSMEGILCEKISVQAFKIFSNPGEEI